MTGFFLKLVNMSISASWLVFAVLLLRLILKKAPKWVFVLLWGLVAIRLVCPFSVESVLSLIPSAETVSPEIMMDRTPEISTGISSVDTVINPVIAQTFTPDPVSSMNPLQLWIPLAAIVWGIGFLAMLLYTAISYILLCKKVATSVPLRDNIFQSEFVDSPFVLGVLRPRIYIPFRMDARNAEHVIAHEQAHIRRKDHWWKPFGFVLLALHWFNPFMWLGYILLCRDIELACDEKVIKEMDSEAKADYTQALVVCSMRRRSIAACPLAFGEVGVKARVKSVMNYKKPAFWIILAAIVVCAAVAVCFLTDPVTPPVDYSVEPPAVKYPRIQEYTPGAEGIVGNVDTQKYITVSPDFEIGADWRGMAVFNDPHKAFMKMTALYADAITAIQKEFDLPPLSETDYILYKTYGWQITSGSQKLREQALFVTQFFDIYENSFIDDAPEHTPQIIDTITTGLRTYYEMDDGTWLYDGHIYKNRLVISGRMPNAATESTFVYLSNLETITFKQAYLAAGLSSNMADYFDVEDAVFVECINGDLSELVAFSGDYSVPLVKVPGGTTAADIVPTLHWLTIAPAQDTVAPFFLLENGVQKIGIYTVLNAETLEPLEFFQPSGLAPQTYLFQNADPGEQYVVLVSFSRDPGAERYAFGARFRMQSSPPANSIIAAMTLSDVQALSELGMELTWEDLRKYPGTETGSGLYIVHYDIDPEFHLAVGDTKTTGKPMYAYLNAKSSGARCDIRESDVAAFIAENQSAALDLAIYKAILEQNAGASFPEDPNGLIATAASHILGIESTSGTPLAGQTNHTEQTTVYVQYVYNRYAFSGSTPERVGSIGSAARITFSVDPEAGYTLKEFWQPNGGSGYAREIRDHFPREIADTILDPGYDAGTGELEAQCVQQAQDYIAKLTDR